MHKQLPIMLIISGGRNGSLFFHSLLDGHPQILQVPCIFCLEKFLEALECDTQKNIANMIVEMYPQFFLSCLNALHGLDRLGDNHDNYFAVDAKMFKQHFDALYDGDRSNIACILQTVHVAYAMSCDDGNVENKKLIVIHAHNARRLEYISRHVKFTSVFLERDILPSLVSEMDGHLSYLKGNHTLSMSLIRLRRKMLEPDRVCAASVEAYTIRLEDLHCNNEQVMRSWCGVYGLDYHVCLKESTFMGMKWWGDDISNRLLNGLNPQFTNTLNMSKLYAWEIACLEGLFAYRLHEYRYHMRSAGKRKSKYFLLLPGKYEVRIFFENLKQCFCEKSLKKRAKWLLALLAYSGIVKEKYQLIACLKKSQRLPVRIVPMSDPAKAPTIPGR